jgi:leucyl-tRNA synthetase
VPILPADFVDPDMASGLVMSVPHAPYDYIALRDLPRQGKYTWITPFTLIRVPSYGDIPAKDAVEKAGIENQLDSLLEQVTQDLYTAEFSKGRLLEKYCGQPVREARDTVSARLVAEYGSSFMYEFDNRTVTCRCGGRVFVKILHDQWFLRNKRDNAWKSGAAQIRG